MEKTQKKPISQNILFWLLIIVVITFLVTAAGAFILLSAGGKKAILFSIGESGYIFRADENLVVTASNMQDMIGKTLPELGFPVEKGNFAFIHDEHYPVMGVWDDEHYESSPFEMDPGDCLFVYTDGVTEAINEDRALFGEQRTLKALNRNSTSAASELIENVCASISEFTGDAAPFDDITMLCVEYRGPVSDQ